MANTTDITLKAQCHCGHASYSYALPTSAFPLKSALCHCQSCRRATGQLFGTFVVIPYPDRPDVSQLTAYISSPNLKRYFCPLCGASVVNEEKDEWEFASGILDKTKGLLNRVQLFVGDTCDGGAASWLAATLPVMYLGHRTSESITAQQVKEMRLRSPDTSKTLTETLAARCHCGDVSFSIAKDVDKYRAGLDACTSCRKVTGFEITAWVTVPRSNITTGDGRSLDLASTRLKKYSTSPGVFRYFCRQCGATIFYLKDGKDTIDVGVGLLQGQKGARAEEFLTWDKYEDWVAYQEDAIDPLLIDGLAKEIKKSRSAEG